MNCTTSMMATGGIDDDVIDPLFDNDWLQEHNLDVLFDLFEQEVGMKDTILDDGITSSSFGSPPVASCLFGTSPSLMSTLDLYDLIYSDCQQTAPVYQHPQQTQSNSTTTTTTTTGGSGDQVKQSESCAPQCCFNAKLIDKNKTSTNANPIFTSSSAISINTGKTSRSTISGKYSDCRDRNQLKPSSVITSMRIKRKLKKGQYEGTSLLARPSSMVEPKSNCNGGSVGQASGKICAKISLDSGRKSNPIDIYSNIIKTISKSQSDKINSARTINPTTCSGALTINPSRQGANNRQIHHHHIHLIQGCSITREHAYAVRGH